MAENVLMEFANVLKVIMEIPAIQNYAQEIIAMEMVHAQTENAIANMDSQEKDVKQKNVIQNAKTANAKMESANVKKVSMEIIAKTKNAMKDAKKEAIVTNGLEFVDVVGDFQERNAKSLIRNAGQIAKTMGNASKRLKKKMEKKKPLLIVSALKTSQERPAILTIAPSLANSIAATKESAMMESVSAMKALKGNSVKNP